MLSGCGGSSSTATTSQSPAAVPTRTAAKTGRAILRHAVARVRKLEEREIRLVEDHNMIGPPNTQTVRVNCPRSRVTLTVDGATLGCTATLYLGIAPDLPILGEKWRVKVSGSGRIRSAAPLSGYEIRAFFEADNVDDCSGALLQARGDLTAAADGLSPCLS
jgi:hypothetical protein